MRPPVLIEDVRFWPKPTRWHWVPCRPYSRWKQVDKRAFFERLDRTRYQAWFFQYPSGASLESMSHLLYWKLSNLQLRYRFERLHVVAHSMGGLVVRRFLLDHGEQFPHIGELISLSTPWGGESSATLGVEHSPAVVAVHASRRLQPAAPKHRWCGHAREPAASRCASRSATRDGVR